MHVRFQDLALLKNFGNVPAIFWFFADSELRILYFNNDSMLIERLKVIDLSHKTIFFPNPQMKQWTARTIYCVHGIDDRRVELSHDIT